MMSRNSRNQLSDTQMEQETSLGTRKYEAACKELNENVRNYLASHQLDVSEDESSEADEEQEISILEKIVANYDSTEQNKDLQQRLHDAFRTGGLICLVCIDNVKRNDQIWSCEQCRCSFHLGCIQKWAKNSVFKKAQEQDEASAWNNPMTREQKSAINWCCPNCRVDYQQTDIPSVYTCFCGKKINPPFDPWLIPHSCGESCDKNLDSQCGHKCRLLCHPGKCPPCPVMISSPCHCGCSRKVKRCSNKHWSCQQPCGKTLGCQQHSCARTCHEGPCEPCPKLSLQKCSCGREEKERLCAEPHWKCQKVCGKRFDCGHHECQVVCHDGPCGDCPMTGLRKCPCGKSSGVLPCTEVIPPCGDTCGKALSCTVHFCTERCHKGSCPSCLQYMTKTCRCGSRQKNMACSKVFTCEVKCKRLRDCGKHQCNRKCCPGDCAPCEQPCNRMLACKSHRCESRCHPGLCFPCRLTHKMTCACGRTSIVVPCGREKTAPKPKCFFDCRKKSKCHHPRQTKHKCHAGDCPSCQQTCNEVMSCGHQCAAPCHDVVPVQVADTQKRSGPWERPTAPIIELRKLEHPKCQVGVKVSCFGEHEPSERECWKAKQFSCGAKCGRTLRCTNHECQLECHRVEGSPKDHTKAGKNCQTCSRQCSKTRPPGCTHVCMRECHPGPCPPCERVLRMACHCSLLQKSATCIRFLAMSAEERETFLSCTNYCNRTLACGHQCQKSCHSGECTPAHKCQKKVTYKCPCKRMRKDVTCGAAQTEDLTLKCNEACQRTLEQRKREEDVRQKEMEERNRKKRLEKEAGEDASLKRKSTKETKKKKQKVWWKSQFVIISFSIFMIIIALLCTQ